MTCLVKEFGRINPSVGIWTGTKGFVRVMTKQERSEDVFGETVRRYGGYGRGWCPLILDFVKAVSYHFAHADEACVNQRMISAHLDLLRFTSVNQ